MSKTYKHTKENIFEVFAPENAIPLVFDSPHSGCIYPEDFDFSCHFDLLRKGEDQHVEELFSRATDFNASFLHALFPRTYIDVNRAIDDIDHHLLAEKWPHETNTSERSHAGIGLIRRILRPGVPVYNRALSVEEIKQRIDNYYTPYHNALHQLINDAHYNYGQVWHVNCHSMPAASDSKLFTRRCVSNSLADFVLGDRNGTSCDLDFIYTMRDFLKSLGYSVSLNTPYRGVEIVKRYGQPDKGMHSVQIEINKALYWNEDTAQKNRNFNALKRDIDKFIGHCASYVQNNLIAMAAD